LPGYGPGIPGFGEGENALTTLCDHYRKSYGRYTDDYPRSCCFCGSTNAAQYLNDPTGARRFWPVRVLRLISIQRIEADRDQLWAEAYTRWRNKEAWHINTPRLLALCEAEQEARFEVDGWEEKILRWFDDPTKFSRIPIAVEPNSVFRGVAPFDGSQGVTTADVLEHALNKHTGHWTNGDTQRVGRVLQHRLKMKRTRVRVGKSGLEWRYLFPST